jgi:photosystem II stability/assembly factor-like uncharacterized protein
MKRMAMRDRMPTWPAFRAVLALALAGGAGTAAVCAPPAHAQAEASTRGGLPEPGDGFTWKRVGDIGIDVRDLAFGSDSTLWAAGDDGPYRLDLSVGLPGVWVLLTDEGTFGDAILPLGRGPDGDTLLATNGTTKRSTDGGRTWARVHDEGDAALYEIPAGLPYAGRILVDALFGIAYSDDRGASFTPSVVPDPDGNTASAEDFAALPVASAHPGRILAAGRWGVNVSDDGGQTFRESALWQVLYYNGEAIGVVKEPGGGVAVLGGRVSAQADARAWTSADGGETWGPGDGQHLLEGPPNDGGAVAVFALGGASVLVVLGGGTVYRSDDAGQTWAPVGRAPQISTSVYAAAAALGPDGRLYVGLSAVGSEDGWVWRTGEVLVAAELGPEPAEDEVLGVAVEPNPFRDEATVTVTLARPSEASASVHDVLGRRVALLHEGALSSGSHAFGLNGSALPAGVYVVRAAAGGAVATRTVTRLR